MSGWTIITDPQAWNDALQRYSGVHVLQTYEWGAVKARWGWEPLRLLFQEGSRVYAAASVLRRPLLHTPFCLLYVPKGPAFNRQDLTIWGKVVQSLESLARQERAILLKIDPDLRLNTGTESRQLEPAASAVVKLLAERGWRFSPEQIQFRSTILIDLRPSEDDILMSMSSKTRYNIRLAERRDVRVEEAGETELARFYQLYAETSLRDGFLIRPFAYYRDVWQTFLSAKQGQLLLAYHGEQCLAGLFLFRWGDTAWYFYGASSGQERQRMPNHALQWSAIRWAKSQGCTTYDLWGAPEVFNDSDPLWGVYRFKSGFGGQVVRYLGAYDYTVYPILYRIFGDLLPRYRSLLRRGRGQSRSL